MSYLLLCNISPPKAITLTIFIYCIRSTVGQGSGHGLAESSTSGSLPSHNHGIGWGCSYLKSLLGQDPLPSSFMWLRALDRRPPFFARCQLEATLSSLPCGPHHGQLTTQQLASSEQANKNQRKSMGESKVKVTVFII